MAMKIALSLFVLLMIVAFLVFFLSLLKKEKATPYSKVFSKEFLSLAERVWASMYYRNWDGFNINDKVWTIDMIKTHFRGCIVSEFRFKSVDEIPETTEKAIDAYIKLKLGDAVAASFV